MQDHQWVASATVGLCPPASITKSRGCLLGLPPGQYAGGISSTEFSLFSGESSYQIPPAYILQSKNYKPAFASVLPYTERRLRD